MKHKKEAWKRFFNFYIALFGFIAMPVFAHCMIVHSLRDLMVYFAITTAVMIVLEGLMRLDILCYKAMKYEVIRRRNNENGRRIG